jgi:hypothetical protein
LQALAGQLGALLRARGACMPMRKQGGAPVPFADEVAGAAGGASASAAWRPQ